MYFIIFYFILFRFIWLTTNLCKSRVFSSDFCGNIYTWKMGYDGSTWWAFYTSESLPFFSKRGRSIYLPLFAWYAKTQNRRTWKVLHLKFIWWEAYKEEIRTINILRHAILKFSISFAHALAIFPCAFEYTRLLAKFWHKNSKVDVKKLKL